MQFRTPFIKNMYVYSIYAWGKNLEEYAANC